MRTRWIFCCLVCATLGTAQQLARDFFDDTVVHDVRIDLDPNDWATLKKNYQDNTYYHANVTSGNLSAMDVGIRSRGRGSRSPDKPNIDVNVNKYVKKLTFANLGFFILKANNQDGSLLHEIMAFKLTRKMGLPAPRESFARLYINGEYFGFYTIVEHEDEDFLTRNFGEDTGDLFEWKPNDNYHFEDRGTDPSAYAIFLDPKTNEDNPNLQKFADFVQAVNHSTDENFIAAISQYVDPKLYLTEAATENAVAELDGVWADTYGTNNIYLYRFTGQDLFQFIVWDKDLAFQQPGRELFQATADNVLARRLLAIPEYRNFYLGQLAKAANLLGGTGGWADMEAARLYLLIHDSAINDPHKQCLQDGGSIGPCGSSAFEQGYLDFRNFLAARQTSLRDALNAVNAPQAVSSPAIASVIADSISGGTQIVPGSLIRIQGAGFGAEMTAEPTLPRASGRSFVAVDGARAPLLLISNSEAIVQLPWEIPAGSTSIAVSANGAMGNTIDVPVVRAKPGLLAATHADGSLITQSAPAHAGEIIVIYAVGLGEVAGSVDNGKAPSTTRLFPLIHPATVQAGTAPAEVQFAGLTPGWVGLYQVNVALPPDTPPGALTITVFADGRSDTITIAIQ